MGTFLRIHSDAQPLLGQTIGSCRQDVLDRILATRPPFHATGLEGAVRRLVAGTHPTVEAAQAAEFVRAFEWICTAFTPASACSELWLDPAFPELRHLVFPKERPASPFKLPKPREGGQRWVHWPFDRVQELIGGLKAIDHDRRSEDSGLDVRESVEEILEVLTAAREAGQGVLIFVDE